MFRIHPGILEKCPVKDLIPDFPCPGQYKHSFNSTNLENSCLTRKQDVLFTLGVFSDIRIADHCSKHECLIDQSDPSGDMTMLSRVLLRMNTKNVNKIIQLGGLFNINYFEDEKSLSLMLSKLNEQFKKSHAEVLHVMGDQETNVRLLYMKSEIGLFFQKFKIIKEPTRCCGSTYYSTSLSPDYMLIVLDGYELLTIDMDQQNQISSMRTNETTTTDFLKSISENQVKNSKCFQCQSKSENQKLWWGYDFYREDNNIIPSDLDKIPLIRTAISAQQLQWLNARLCEATRKTQNVIIACHAPLHPLLVENRSTLVTNWKNILRIIMNFNCVRLVISGRPTSTGAQPSNTQLPFQYDHGIVYYSLPPLWELTKLDNLAWTHMIIKLGYDFIQIEGEGIQLPDHCEQTHSWTVPFEPRRKRYVNNFDYAYNCGYD